MNDRSSLEHLPSYIEASCEPTCSNDVQEYYAPMNFIRTLQLVHVDRKRQTFSLPPGTAPFHYSIQVNDTGGFTRKPDLVIARERGTSAKIGEGRFEKYGPGTTIKYSELGEIHDLQLESSISQRFRVTVNGTALWWWQPSRSNKQGVEVVTAGNELIAQFTYSGEHASLGRDAKDDTILGVLEVDGQYLNQHDVLDQLVSITVVLVERTRRRGRNLRGFEGTSPLTNLSGAGNLAAGVAF